MFGKKFVGIHHKVLVNFNQTV